MNNQPIPEKVEKLFNSVTANGNREMTVERFNEAVSALESEKIYFSPKRDASIDLQDRGITATFREHGLHIFGIGTSISIKYEALRQIVEACTVKKFAPHTLPLEATWREQVTNQVMSKTGIKEMNIKCVLDHVEDIAIKPLLDAYNYCGQTAFELRQSVEELKLLNDRQNKTIERLANRETLLEENDRLKQEVKELQECNDRQKATIEHFMAPDPHRATLLEENKNLKREVEVLRNNDRLHREWNFPYMIKEKTYQEEQLDQLGILSCQTFEQRINATIRMYKLEREATGKLRSLLRRMALSMKAHPDWQPDSEFADYVESAEELLEETTGLGAPETEVLEAEKEKDVEHLHAKEEEQGPFDSTYSPLFDFFQQNHDLTLLHGEMDDIVHAVDKMAGYTATINRIEKEYAEALEELSKVQETTMALIEREGEIWKAFGQFSAAMVSVLKKQDNA